MNGYEAFVICFHNVFCGLSVHGLCRLMNNQVLYLEEKKNS